VINRLRILTAALLIPAELTLACATEEPWAERVDMVSLGTVPTVTIPVVTIPQTTTTSVPPPATTVANVAVPAATTTTVLPPATTQPEVDVPFTVATATVGLLETFRTPDAKEPW
jgi:hypothetical protein|tara:strand:+ start:299 stop:643 length:345 start_codon:yes stop_codon:yes gene_type:complete